MATILVTDGDQRSSLAAVRSLGRCGHRVLACASRTPSLAGASRYVEEELQVPEVTSDVEAFCGAVTEMAATRSCEIVLPMTDPSALALLEHRAGRALPYSIPMPPLETFLLASDKAELGRIAEEEGIPVPGQAIVEVGQEAAAEAFGERIGWPVVLKPARSAFRAGQGLGRTNVRIVHDGESCRQAMATFPEGSFPVLVQRRIRGPGLGVFLLAVEGEVRAVFAHRRLREKPPTGGVSVYRESMGVRPELEDHGRRLMARLGWTGVAMVEFKEDSETGVAHLMEINPRFWGSLQLAIDAGVDFPRLLVQATLGQPVDPVSGYALGVRSRWFWGEVDHLLWILRASPGFRTRHPHLPGRLGALARFLVPWRPGDRWEVLRFSDPRPFLRESLTWFSDLRR